MANFLGLKYPIIANNPKGYWQKTSGNETIKSDLLILLQTQFTERVMLPKFGCGLRQLLFQQNNAATENQAKALVINAINEWEPRVAISQLSTNSNQNTPSMENVLNVTASFSQLDNLSNVDNLTLQLPIG